MTAAKENFQTIFPQYLDSNFTPEQGRKISRCKAVPGPTLDEIFIALKQMGYTGMFADPMKSLPCLQSSVSIFPAPRGCIKVSLKAGEPGSKTAVNSKFATKGDVLRGVAAIISKMDNRKPAPAPDTAYKGQKKQAVANEKQQRSVKKKR